MEYQEVGTRSALQRARRHPASRLARLIRVPRYCLDFFNHSTDSVFGPFPGAHQVYQNYTNHPTDLQTHLLYPHTLYNPFLLTIYPGIKLECLVNKFLDFSP